MSDQKSELPQGDGQASSGSAGPGTTASGYKGQSGATAGPGKTAVESSTPENAKGRLNPSAPEDSNSTPGSTGDK